MKQHDCTAGNLEQDDMTQLHSALRFHSAILLFSFAAALIALLTGCSGSEESAAQRGNGKLIPAVEAVQSKYGSLPLTERLSGAVKAKNQVELYPQISAAIVRVFVQNGELVNAGDPLIRLRDTELKEQLKQAEANLQIARAQSKQADAEMQQAKQDLKRNIALSDKNLISATQLEDIQTKAVSAEANAELAKARADQAQALVDERKEDLSKTVIRAPVDGTVGGRHAEVGMLVTPSTRVFTIGKLDSVEVDVVLTDRMLSYIKVGQRARIVSHSLSFGDLEAPVARVSPFLHPVTHSTMAEIDLPNPDHTLKPGGFVTVDIFYGESEKATLVPLSALWENPATATTGVFVSLDSLKGEPVAKLDDPDDASLTDPVQFQFIPVDVIAKGRMSAGVSGLDSGRWVVTIGQDLLGHDSASARVRPVSWDWVEDLQQLQREDLLEQIIRKKSTSSDSSLIGMTDTRDASTP